MKATHHKLIDALVNASLECGVEKALHGSETNSTQQKYVQAKEDLISYIEGLRSEIEMLILRGEVI